MRERLLERLINLDHQNKSNTYKNEIQRLLQSVTTHLHKILNTRKGSVVCDPDYGMTDFSDLPGTFLSPETEEIQKSIGTVIEKYERRLKDVEVKFEKATDSDLTVGFKISGTIYHLGEVVPLHLKTQMSADSKFSIDRLV
jgi:type VI secretion system protein